MKRHFLGFAAVTVLAFGLGCASDPTGDLTGDVASVGTSLSDMSVNVGDSVAVVAETRDAQGNALSVLPEAASQDPSIVVVVPSDLPPLSQHRFYVKALAFGTGEIVVTSGGQSATIAVSTFPGRVAVTGAPDTLGSGATAQLAPEPQDVQGNPIDVPSGFTWRSSDADVIAVDSTGLATAKAPGIAVVTVTAPGGVTGTAPITVVPGTFGGTLSATSGDFGDILVIKPGTVAWDGDEIVTVGGVTPWIEDANVDSIALVIPDIAVGPQEILIVQQGPDEVASIVTYTVNNGYTQNSDPFTAPDITAGPYPQVFYISLDNASPDDFFTIAPGADLDLTVTLEWVGGADMDILWYDLVLDDFVGNFDGATGANPENSSVTVPGGESWTLWFNKFDTTTAGATIKVTITSP